MIHTFELSKMLSEETFEELLSLPEFNYYKKNLWKACGYESQGLSTILLYKVTQKKGTNKPD